MLYDGVPRKTFRPIIIEHKTLVHCSASATGRTTQRKMYNLLSAEVPYLTAK